MKFRLAFALAATLLLPAASLPAAPDRAPIVIGVGPVASFSFPLGGELCRLYEIEAGGGAHCYVAVTGGSVDAIDRLRSGELAFAVVQSDQAGDALAAHGAFATRQPYPELRSVAGFFGDALTILVRADGRIGRVDDLHGKRVAVGEPAAPDPLFSDLLDSLGWTKADLAGVAEMPRGDQITALCNRKVAAIAVTAPHPNGFVRQAMATCPVTIVDLAGAGIDSILALHRAYGPARIDLAAYGVPTRILQSFGPRAVLATDLKTDDASIALMLEAIFKHVDQLQKSHPAFAGLDAATIAASGGLGAERHPAAAKYLTDNNISSTPTGD